MTAKPATPFRILIVEDDADCAETTAVLLRMDGYAVEIAPDGPSALAMAVAIEPDVVLLDIGLPRMNGFEVARRLTAPRPRRTPLVIAVTGYGRDDDHRHGAECGIDLHLTKPVDPVLLFRVLRRFARAACPRDRRPEGMA